MLRSHTCGQLRREHIGQEVKLCGWVDRHRDLGQLFFVSLRDRYGLTQCVFENEDNQNEVLLKTLKSLNLEDCIRVSGLVKQRSDKDINEALPTGAIEVVISNIEILNPCQTLPFQVKDQTEASDELRLKYRYLDLRRPKMQQHMAIRHQVIQSTRTALSQMGFLELETPLLIRSTPEGARDFVVPARLHPGKFYALPQSPQLYKQMLMISGCDRYFQFAPAFRDEDLRADRVPVHTQIDMEMTFVEESDVFAAVETYMSQVFKDILGKTLQRPFPIMPYSEAMERYGSDKPDTRFGLELVSVTDLCKQTKFKVFAEAPCVRLIQVPNASSLSRKDIDELEARARTYGAKGLAWTRVKDGAFTGGVGKFIDEAFDLFKSKLTLADDTLLLFVADSYATCCAALNSVRLELGKRMNLIPEGTFNFLWVNNFPLFEWDETRQAFNAMHHLFTQPKAEDMHLLDSDPARVRGQLYDLVLNGVELCSGSIRINRPELQQKILDLVKMPREEAQSKFGFLLESFKYGAPPHGGSAVGLDRLVAMLCGTDSIREVIPYPCNNSGIFPLDGSPAEISEEQLQELKLTFRK